MKPLNVVAESLKSLGVDSRAVAQATGISETNLTAAPSKKCANAPVFGALFSESPDPTTMFEHLLKEGTPGFSTDEKLAESLHGLTAALKLAENAEDPQARLAVIVRAVQLAERAGVSKTRQEAAQAFAAWIAGVYLRGIPGGSTKMEVELRVELARAIEQRDNLSKMLADAEVGHAAELEDAAKRAMLSSDSLHNARMAEIRGIAAILGATEEESLEDAARRAAREREEAQRKCLEQLPAVPTEAQILEGIQKLLKSHKVAPIPVLPFEAEVTFVPPKTPAIDHLFKLGATLVTVDADQDGTLLVAGLSDEAMAEAQGVMPMGVKLKKHNADHQLKAMAAAQALCKQDQEPAERIAELDVWLRSAEQRERELRAHNDGCHAEIARAQSEITRLSEELMAEKKAREAADLKSTMAWATQTEGWAEYQRLRVEVEALVKESKVHEVPALLPVELLAAVDRVEQVMKRVEPTGEPVITVDAMHAEYRRQIESLTTSLRGAMAELEKWRDSSAKWLRLQAEVGMVLGRQSGENLVDAARRVRADACVTLGPKLGRRPGESLTEAAQRVMSELASVEGYLSERNRELDKLRERYEDTRKQNEVAGQHLGKQDHEALAHAAKRVAQTAEAHAHTITHLESQIGALQATIYDLKRSRLIGGERDLFVIASELGKQQHETLEEAAARVRANAEGRLAVEKELVTVTVEIEKLRSQVEDVKKTMSADFEAQMRVSEGLREQTEALQAERNSLRAEVTMLRDELKTQKAEREEDKKELAELAIELGQQVGERLITAARRVRETGTHAEVERLQKVCSHHADRLREKFAEVDAIAKALGEHDGMTDEEAARALVAERDQLRGVVEDLTNRLKSAQLSKLDAAAVLECGENESPSAAVRRVVNERNACRDQLDGAEVSLAVLRGEVDQLKQERDELRRDAKDLRADKEAFAHDARRVRLELETEIKNLKEKLGSVEAELRIIDKRYDEALELCDRDGMTPAEQIKELRKELEDIRPEAEQMAGWRQSSLNRQVEIQNLQAALAEEKKQRQDFVAALCAELGVEGGERTVMTAVEQLKENHKRLGERVASVPNVASPMPHYDGTVPIGSWVKHGEDRDPTKSEQTAQIIGTDGGMYAVKLANGQVGIWNFARCVPCDPPAAPTSEAEQKKHPEWVRHTKGFNDLKPGTVARVLGVQGDPPDAYKVKRINGPEGSWIIANCEPCEAPSDAGHVVQKVQKATTRPADSSCTCHQSAPCAHCTWYSDRGMDEPEGTPDSGKPDAADGGLVMAD